VAEDNQINFTKHKLEQLLPDKTKRVTYRDERTVGLILRIETSGVKSFCWLRKGAGQACRNEHFHWWSAVLRRTAIV
jgi:hypothetical protein